MIINSFFTMPFKTKKHNSKSGSQLKHGLYQNAEGRKLVYAKRHVRKINSEDGHEETQLSSASADASETFSSPPSTSSSSSIPPPSLPMQSLFRPSLRSTEPRRSRQGRPTLLEEALTEDQQNERKRKLYRDKKKAAETSASRRLAALRRWHPEVFVNEKPIGEKIAEGEENEEEEEEEVPPELQECGPTIEEQGLDKADDESVVVELSPGVSLGGEGDGVDVCVGDVIADVDSGVGERSGGDTGDGETNQSSVGESKASQTRTRNFLSFTLLNRDPLQEVDLVRQLCLDFKRRGVKTDGIDVTARDPVSNLSKRQLRYASEKVWEKMKSTSSMRRWLPSLLQERLVLLESKLGR